MPPNIKYIYKCGSQFYRNNWFSRSNEHHNKITEKQVHRKMCTRLGVRALKRSSNSVICDAQLIAWKKLLGHFLQRDGMGYYLGFCRSGSASRIILDPAKRPPRYTSTATRGKGCTFFLIYLFWKYSMLVILPRLNCLQVDTGPRTLLSVSLPNLALAPSKL